MFAPATLARTAGMSCCAGCSAALHTLGGNVSWCHHLPECWCCGVDRLAPEGQRAIEGQKAQPTGAKAQEGAKGGPQIGPKRGSNVRMQHPLSCLPFMPACSRALHWESQRKCCWPLPRLQWGALVVLKDCHVLCHDPGFTSEADVPPPCSRRMRGDACIIIRRMELFQ